ncbi:glycosyltransferase [Cellulomonas sp. Leaf334]|uniref:glycosyltransferase n=1 Tax=Cellulomonas sp. Leaf334 TaxID=1736339 RepID=UPI0006F2D4C6|nr:glycosyltransferase [Cellulomonas sp. Leaf334]KQR16693.1 glycosyl transferase family 1 [Cellulomonas sp. Leaf334]
MRVVQVSAHYPPNFVSGGTLVPQRVARGMAERGHESWVYAGHLDADREPLSTWTESDGAGVDVRWVVTTPWTGWADPRNSENPAVAADFDAWLAEIRPDVVHIHSLQTLGGGLVDAAKASGAAVVVTMHDFWWSCARQFLVDRDMRPCSLVVDCGGCACQVDHEWLLRRDAALSAHLVHADVVLAPSASAARVLAANGVDPEILRVDENGVPDEVLDDVAAPAPARSTPGHGGPLRLLFTGGADPMKGLPVLLEAARDLPDDGWTLDLFGAGDLPSGLPSAVVSRAPYRPDELRDVLATHDVLVLPSVMRESHSIVTREALAAGLAVVCTDTLGPEEAVDDGRNGLVVPAGDPAALAAALSRLVADPALVASMRTHTPSATLRRASDQVAGLEALYLELLGDREAGDDGAVASARAVQTAQDGLLRNVLFVTGINGAPLRYRVQLAAEALRTRGATPLVRHYRDPELTELVDRADAVVLYRVPATVQTLELIERVRARPRVVPVLFDVDDLIVDPSLRGSVHGLDVLSEAEQDLWWHGVARYRTTLEAADLYVGSTQLLCERVGDLTGLPTRRFANGVGRAMAQVSERAAAAPRAPGPLRIGYFSGTTTHDADWAQVEPAVLDVMRARPDVELWLGGHLVPTPALDEMGERVRRQPMVPWYELPRLLRDVDVNLAPLVPGSVFNESKSAIKWLEAAMVGTPTIATPTQPFAEVIEHGRTGLLASDADEWAAALARLLDDDAERAALGRRAGRHALLTLSPHTQAAVYESILRDAAQHVRDGGRERTVTWEPVADDEPLSATDAYVEPYPGIPVDGHRSRVPGAVRPTLDAVRRVYGTGGVRGVARKSVDVARRRLGR